MPGRYFVFTGSSGAGKSSIVDALLVSVPNSTRLITTTTRAPRPGEIDGKDYFFTSREDFIARKHQGEFFEHDEHYGTCYGSSQKDLDALLSNYKVVFGIIDVNGSAKLKKIMPSCVVTFVDVDHIADLEERLRTRKGMDAAQLALRLGEIQRERNEAKSFDHVVVNRKDALEETIAYCAELVTTSLENTGDGVAVKRQKASESETPQLESRADKEKTSANSSAGIIDSTK